MREKNREISMLLDFYGDLLGEKQRECVEMYYDEDMSLAEIGQVFGITRQGVLDYRVRAVKRLREFEASMGLIKRSVEQQAVLDEMNKQLDRLAELSSGQAVEIIRSLRENLSKISI